MPYRNKTYVCFDADNDIHWYRLMTAWSDNENFKFNFYNAHDLTTIRPGSTEESIKASLRERMRNSKVLVVLIGTNTRFCNTYVKWEIELAIKHGLPIIAINLNGDRKFDENLCPKALRETLAIHVPFKEALMTYALDNWPDRHAELKAEGEDGPRWYKDSVYSGLGL
jgi:hypothetical protein